LGYAFWRILQSVMDTDHHGLDLKGIVIRVGLACSAATYFTLALYALSLEGMASGSGGGGGGFARTLESLAGARVVSLSLGLVFAGIALAHAWKAWKRGYRRYIHADADVMHFLDPVSRIGLAARGLIFAILSTLSFYRFAGSRRQGGSSPGLEEALKFVQELPFGWLLLIVVGAGLIVFAFYSFAEAVWRSVNVGGAAARALS